MVFHVLDFPAVDDIALTYTMTLYLEVEWEEPRLSLNTVNLTEESLYYKRTLNMNALDLLWRPDLFIDSLVTFEEMKVCMSTMGNESDEGAPIS